MTMTMRPYLRTAERTYPAPGAPDVAMRAKQLLEDAGFAPVTEDRRRRVVWVCR